MKFVKAGESIDEQGRVTTHGMNIEPHLSSFDRNGVGRIHRSIPQSMHEATQRSQSTSVAQGAIYIGQMIGCTHC